MSRHAIAPTLSATVFSLILIGCTVSQSSAPTSRVERGDTDAGSSFTFAPEQYPAVHAAVSDVLRDNGFRIARNDYRFGSVTTYPKESPTAMEFWIDDPTTRGQHKADTLNAHQRSVAVTVAPTESDPQRYVLSVEVQIHRLQQPARYLTHSARGPITAEYDAAPTHLSDRGITEAYAYPLERDPHLEARLQEAIASTSRE